MPYKVAGGAYNVDIEVLKAHMVSRLLLLLLLLLPESAGWVFLVALPKLLAVHITCTTHAQLVKEALLRQVAKLGSCGGGRVGGEGESRLC